MAEQHGGKKVVIGRDPILIGRSQECKIVFKDGPPGVSGRHCALTWDAEKRSFILKQVLAAPDGYDYDKYNALRSTYLYNCDGKAAKRLLVALNKE